MDNTGSVCSCHLEYSMFFVGLQFILIFSCIEYEPMEYHGYHYPGWAQAIGWLLVVLTLSLIPIWMVIKICKCIGSWHVSWVLKCYSCHGLSNLMYCTKIHY